MRGLVEAGVEESVMSTGMIVVELFGGRRMAREQMAWGRAKHGVGVALKERLHLILAFYPENRAGGIEQTPPRLEQRPQGVEQVSLCAGQLFDIAGPAQPAHIRMAPH